MDSGDATSPDVEKRSMQNRRSYDTSGNTPPSRPATVSTATKASRKRSICDVTAGYTQVCTTGVTVHNIHVTLFTNDVTCFIDYF